MRTDYGQAAEEREEAAAGGAGDVRYRRAEEDAVVELQVGRGGGVALVAVEDFEGDVGADGVPQHHEEAVRPALGPV